MKHKDKPKRTHKSIDPAALRAAEDAIDIREADKALLEYERTGEAISLEELVKELKKR